MPTFIHGKNTAVYIDEFDLTSYFNDTSIALDNDVSETTLVDLYNNHINILKNKICFSKLG